MEPLEMETPLPPATQPATTEGAPGPLGGIAAAIQSQHVAPGADAVGGPAAPKRGRPIKHGLYSKSMGSDGKNPVRVPGPADASPVRPPAVEPAQVESAGEPRVSIPPDLFTKIVGEGLAFGERYAQNRIESAAVRAGLTPSEISPQLQQAELGETRKKVLADLAPLVAEEWGLDPQLSPTAAAAALLGPWLVANVTALKTLEALAREKSARDTKGNAP